MKTVFWLNDDLTDIRKSVAALEKAEFHVHVFESELKIIDALESHNIPDVIIQNLYRLSDLAQLSYGIKRSQSESPAVAGWSFYKDVLKPYFPNLPVIIRSYGGRDISDWISPEDFNLLFIHKNEEAYAAERLAKLEFSIQRESIVGHVRHILNKQVPIHSASDEPSNAVLIDFSRVTEELICHLAKRPSDIHQINWSTFEELVKKILEELGYSVTHTKLTKDGGVDLWALYRTDLGEILYAIDVKKYAPDKVIGPEPVRAIYGVTELNNANTGMIITTAQFGPAALDLSKQYRYRISLKDFDGVMEWIRLVASKHKT